MYFVVFFSFVFFAPDYLGHPDNFIEADPLVTPAHIVPEWYFLPFYAILRAIPNKLGGGGADAVISQSNPNTGNNILDNRLFPIDIKAFNACFAHNRTKLYMERKASCDQSLQGVLRYIVHFTYRYSVARFAEMLWELAFLYFSA